MRGCRAWLQAPGQHGIQRGDGHIHRRQALRRQGRQQVEVALHTAAFGDQRKRMPRIAQHLDHTPREAQLALRRLVAVGGRTDVQHARHMAGARQFGAQHLADVVLGNDLRLEIEPRRQVQIAVRGAGIAIDTAMLATAIGVHRVLKEDVGGIVGAQRAARGFQVHPGGLRRGLRLAIPRKIPAIVHHGARVFCKPVRRGRGSTPAANGMDGNTRFGRWATGEIKGIGIAFHDCMNIQFFRRLRASTPHRFDHAAQCEIHDPLQSRPLQLAFEVHAMARKPQITLSSLDLDRIEALLAAIPASVFPGKADLQAELDRADVVAPEEIPPNVVTMNSTVQFTIEETGKEFCLTLVYPRDMDGSADRISIFAPVGSALLGLAVGDELAWPGPGGKSMTVRVKSIVYQPESAGELHR